MAETSGIRPQIRPHDTAVWQFHIYQPSFMRVKPQIYGKHLKIWCQPWNIFPNVSLQCGFTANWKAS